MVQQAFTGWAQADAARMAVQQGSAERGLQVTETFADGRSGNKLTLSRLANAAQLAHRNKELERGQVYPPIEAAGSIVVWGGDGHGLNASRKTMSHYFAIKKAI
jgi:hypothetical protein